MIWGKNVNVMPVVLSNVQPVSNTRTGHDQPVVSIQGCVCVKVKMTKWSSLA